MSKHVKYILLILGILLLQGFDQVAFNTARKASTSDFLRKFPEDLPGWTYTRDVQLSEGVLGALAPDDYLIRFYDHPQRRISGELLIAYFGSQAEGFGPHSPKVCLPASGWIPTSQTVKPVSDGAGGEFQANRFVIENGEKKSLVLYWYHTRTRTVVGEIEARLWLSWDTALMRSSDIALVRVIVPMARNQEPNAEIVATELATTAYRELRQRWRPE